MSEKKRPRFRDVVQSGELVERTKQAYEQKDASGKFQPYVNSSIPLKQWKCTDGQHVIDILPWLATENNFNKFKVNEAVWRAEVHVHFGIGPNENAYVCPNMTLGIKYPCPICEYRAELKKHANYSEKDYKDLAPKWRVVMQIISYDPPDNGQTVYWWESSHHLSSKKILDIAKSGKGGGFIPFMDPDLKGRHICFRKEGIKDKTDYVGFVLEAREPGDEIPDEILDQTVAIEDYIEILSYEDLELVFYGKSGAIKGTTDTNDEYEDEPPPAEDRERTAPARTSRRQVDDVEEPPPAESRRLRQTPAETTEREEAPPRRSLRQRREEEPPPAETRGTRTRLPETPPEERSTRLTRRIRPGAQQE